MNGWMGNLLRVNLTTKTSSIESSEKYFKYIGGKGMANRITVSYTHLTLPTICSV